jgi:hypothetical protein
MSGATRAIAILRSACPARYLALLFAFSACLGPSGPGEFVGHYSFGFETSSFDACGEDESWWVTGDLGEDVREFLLTDPAFEPDPAFPVRSGRIYMELVGQLSRRGTFGHLGAFPREIRVLEVLDFRLPDEADCQ